MRATNATTLYYIIKGSGSGSGPGSGSGSVVLEDDEGKEVVTIYLNPGDFFGEIGLFAKAEELSAWCRAENACEVAKISYASSIPYIRSHPEIVFTIGQQMAHRLCKTTRKVSDLAFYDVTDRIARTLIDLSKEPDAMTLPDCR